MQGRGYEAYFNYYDKNGVFTEIKNNYCWSGAASVEMGTFKNDEIYVDKYEMPETIKYVPTLVKVINDITPCSVVKVNNKDYIKIKLLKNYNKSLILLSFIRNLWYSLKYGLKDTNKVILTYSDKFFEYLEALEIEDPYLRLTTANKMACEDIGQASMKLYVGAHTNAHWLAKAKTLKQFQDWSGMCTDAERQKVVYTSSYNTLAFIIS